MNPVLHEILSTGTVGSADGLSRVPLHSAMSADEGELIQRMVAEVRPVASVEVGLAFGVSALYLCEALAAVNPSARHTVIDPFQNDVAEGWGGIGLSNLRRAGFGEMVELIEKPSHLALPEMEARGARVEFALIDGWHTFDHALVDFFHVDQILRPGGILVVDDCDMPPVHKVIRYIATNRNYRVVAGTSATGRRPDWKRRVARAVGSCWPIRAIARPEWRRSAEALNLLGSCIAFRKEADDQRAWDAHHEF